MGKKKTILRVTTNQRGLSRTQGKRDLTDVSRQGKVNI